MIKPIKTDADHKAAMAEIERLAMKNPEAGSDDASQLEVLATLVESYEKIHFPAESPTPAEAIEFRMDQMGLVPKDLEPYIGSRSRVSEVLSGKRSLSLRMIRALSEGLDIPTDILVREPPRQLPDDAKIDWASFPINEMVRREWIPRSSAGVEGREEEIMRRYLAPVGGVDLVAPLYRRQVTFSERSGRKMNPYALVAWTARVMLLAKQQHIAEYVPGTVTAEFMRDVAQCSWAENGPLLAKELLESRGIHLVVERHLSRTYLDGSSCLMAKTGAPVIGMSVRHDRIDNFWFVLLHELAHIARHLDISGGSSRSFFDDLDADAKGAEEQEADDLAMEAMIPAEVWETVAADLKPGRIVELANSLKIHAAIVAGRYRHENKDFRKFSKLVGRNKVRVLFPSIKWDRQKGAA